MTCYLQKLHYMSICKLIDDSIQSMINNPKNHGNPLSTPKDMHRTSFNVGNNLLLHCIAFKSEATRIYR